MARKGQKFKTWTTEEKYKIIKPIIEMETSLSKVAKQNIISNSMLHRWAKKYKDEGNLKLIRRMAKKKK